MQNFLLISKKDFYSKQNINIENDISIKVLEELMNGNCQYILDISSFLKMLNKIIF